MIIGDRVLILSESHPHAGKVGVLEGAYTFNHGIGDAVKIVFDNGGACFIFQDGKTKLMRCGGQSMKKAEEITNKVSPKIYRGNGRLDSDYAYYQTLMGVDEALEWAALKIEEFGECECGAPNTVSGHTMNCHHDVAYAIRAGKAKP